jgi:hypothetical protein
MVSVCMYVCVELCLSHACRQIRLFTRLCMSVCVRVCVCVHRSRFYHPHGWQPRPHHHPQAPRQRCVCVWVSLCHASLRVPVDIHVR